MSMRFGKFKCAKMFNPKTSDMMIQLMCAILVVSHFSQTDGVKGSAVDTPSLEESFRQCLVSRPANGFGYCMGVGAITKLQNMDGDPEFDLVDGITLTRDQQQFREVHNFADTDPSDFRTIVDSLGHVFAQRSLRWDMNFLYPGLAMRVAPSHSTAGVLEFVLDPHRESLNAHSLKEAGTGRLLARQFLLPFLLGFKFNVATIIPILFGVLALLAKKAVLVSKIALIVSSAYGLGTLLLGHGNKYPSHVNSNYHGQGSFNPGFGGHYNRFPEDEYQDLVYRGVPAANAVADQLRLYGNVHEAYDREDKSKGRNFAWNEDEKEKKETTV